ncbi:MAG: hypothetical protein SPJ13_04040 [Bacteroidales bacterium]|nr:hypothetical protein [Bacteroidales bacterium]
MNGKILCLAIIMFVSAACFGQNETEQRLRQTISFLASDQLNGRKNGTADADKAADYLKGELKKMGLQVQEYNLTLSQLANKQKALQKRQNEDWVKWYGNERHFEVIDPVWMEQDTSRNAVYQSFFVVIPASGGSRETHLVCANYTGAGVDTVQGCSSSTVPPKQAERPFCLNWHAFSMKGAVN